VDTILDNLILFAPLYKNIVEEYNANLYIKGKMNVIKRNNLIHIVPSAFKLERKVKEYMMESFNEIHFTAPNIYDQKVKAIRGTIPRYRGIPDDMLQYLRMNIYSPTLLYDKILSPLASNSRSYYSFRIDSVTGNGDNLLYKIRITPRNKSYQLISGYMVVSSQLWTVRQMYMEGQSGVMKFNMKVEMGVRGEEAFLPVKHEMNFFFRFLGNRIDGSYTASSVYSKVKISEIKKLKKEKKRYDLSDSFTLTCDTSSLFTDSAHFARIRPIPLNDKEKIIYADYALRHDTMEINKNFQISSREFWGQTGDALLSNYTVNLSRFGSVRCSPIINPFLLSYSHSDGFSYRQDFKYNRLFAGDRLLRIVPKVGYSFKRKEFTGV